MHSNYVPLVSARIPLLVLITVLQRCQIIGVPSSSVSSVAAGSDSPMCSVDAWQLLSFRSIWLALIHVELPDLVLRCPQILQYILDILVGELLMIGS